VSSAARFGVRLDRGCVSPDERVRAAFDREWDCATCGSDLRVLRCGGLVPGCEARPDCETGFAFPEGAHDGTCACGLPAFGTPGGRRYPDAARETTNRRVQARASRYSRRSAGDEAT
jgi:DNA topoisomerase-1